MMEEKNPGTEVDVQMTAEKPSALKELYVLLHDLVYILAFVTLFFVFALRLVSVDGYSMYHTLDDHDYVALLSNVLYQDVKAGDIVVARVPTFSDDPIVKRVIATEGQTVDIDFERGVVYVDGQPLEEDYIYELTNNQFYDRGVTFPLRVNEGCVFVMGDNRNDSRDSRYAPIGQVDTRYILGKVLFVLMPGQDKLDNSRDFKRIGPVS